MQPGQTSVGARYYDVHWDGTVIPRPTVPVCPQPTLVTYEVLGLHKRGTMRMLFSYSEGKQEEGENFSNFHAYATPVEAWTAFVLGGQAEIAKLKVWESALVVADSELEKL